MVRAREELTRWLGALNISDGSGGEEGQRRRKAEGRGKLLKGGATRKRGGVRS